ncbi:LysE/ArgO family amino acid transporter [Curtobacterium flaccumfaciens]|uniref:LysE/ArgO family amino acid transporter n=1 Tax=Curtobacterium flaccumfaciens TaxID=2035 RepID=UPI00159B5B58|nr:LysE family transporter [Curtobacterium flaccumfaciens]MBT1631807.1 LysE family transporter [Curtobacterium flaccumfaciens pv. oortii]MCX2844727.1 LysE family transporter [Curtobacterium flaccumfaciens pv. oortii]QKS88953.1 amino acid transporter [Curtobacterium flaccumfaciens pv. flaccumfaciens]
MTTLLPLLSGLGTGLALIVAIGVQNTYLLRLAVSAGLRVVAAAVVVCAASDALLIVAGVLGVGAVVERFPVALLVVRFVGAAFLLTYGVLAARRALRPSGDAMRVADEAADDGVVGAGASAGVGATTGATVAAGRTRTAPPGQVVTMRTAVLTMLVFTWANPHVYLDTLVFLGSVANQQGADDRWLWTIGAVTASCLWFGALGFGGRLLRPLFEKPLTWRVFDGLVAVVMLAFGVLLLVGA